MALIAMAVYSTEENGKDECLNLTLHSLGSTVDFSRHRLIVSVNAATEKTEKLLNYYTHHGVVSQRIDNEVNIGTAQAINKAWLHRSPLENAVKMDDDVVIYGKDWCDELEEAVLRDPAIGICGLKRKDCWEKPDHTEEFYRSTLYMLPHKTGERWIVAEQVKHVIGTCQMYSASLLENLGYLYQPKLYGFDDVLAAVRCNLAGFKSVFLPHINIDHIDPGDTPYQKWKESHAASCWQMYHTAIEEYKTGKRPLYYNPFEENKTVTV